MPLAQSTPSWRTLPREAGSSRRCVCNSVYSPHVFLFFSFPMPSLYSFDLFFFFSFQMYSFCSFLCYLSFISTCSFLSSCSFSFFFFYLLLSPQYLQFPLRFFSVLIILPFIRSPVLVPTVHAQLVALAVAAPTVRADRSRPR